MNEVDALRAARESRADVVHGAAHGTSHAEVVQRMVDVAVFREAHRTPAPAPSGMDSAEAAGQPAVAGEAPATHQIVVGVDGSAASRAALRWAVRHAGTVGAAVTAVEVQRQPHVAPGTSYAVQPYGTVPPADRIEHEGRLHTVATEAAASVLGAPPVAELRVQGAPGAELARIAVNADLLVLGHTPHGRVAEFVLGSTAGECLRKARCPVVLVPVDIP